MSLSMFATHRNLASISEVGPAGPKAAAAGTARGWHCSDRLDRAEQRLAAEPTEQDLAAVVNHSKHRKELAEKKLIALPKHSMGAAEYRWRSPSKASMLLSRSKQHCPSTAKMLLSKASKLAPPQEVY